ncbi:MmpS family transport accessory protein [Mycobacterium sp.]|uniref:MmpS family transport accessory protein n=1 Tax=Mycobacterium sp. TaxID=1785 RepID=UPI003D12F55C
MTSRAILVAALTAFAATVGPGGTAYAGSDTQVSYDVSGSAPVADYVSYQLAGGQTQQANVPLPWKTQFTVNGSRVLVISAEGPGSITCTIRVDGKVVNQATAHGAPARTVCST